MADLSITAANVLAGTGVTIKQGTAAAGVTITAGKALAGTSAAVKLAKDDITDNSCIGIALNGASPGQPVSYMDSGEITIGAAVTAGAVYGITDTAGGIALISERGSTDYVTIIGVGISTTVIKISRIISGVAIPA